MTSSDPQQDIIVALQHIEIRTYVAIASVVVLFYDYVLTFSREVEVIWPGRWTSMKFLYLLTRYLPFADLCLRMWLLQQTDPSIHSCEFVFSASSWLFYVGTALAEIILTLRTWAVWNRDRRMAIGLLVFFAACWVPCIPVVVIYNKSLRFSVYSSDTPQLSGCFTTSSSHIVFVSWMLLLVYEAGIFLLMLIKGISCYKNGGNTRLFHVVFRDGLIYYLYLFGFVLANVIVVATVSHDLQLVLVVAERFIHPILACRAVLDIRYHVAHVDGGSLSVSWGPKPPAIASEHTASSSPGDVMVGDAHASIGSTAVVPGGASERTESGR